VCPARLKPIFLDKSLIDSHIGGSIERTDASLDKLELFSDLKDMCVNRHTVCLIKTEQRNAVCHFIADSMQFSQFFAAVG